MTSLPERFWRRVVKLPGDGCWLFVSTNMGYGEFTIAGRLRPAHRLTYEDAIGPIPEGLQIDHLCRMHPCVRPSHLEAVTPSENVKRGWAVRKNPSVAAADRRRAESAQRYARDCRRVS